jgi:hypothetical protein
MAISARVLMDKLVSVTPTAIVIVDTTGEFDFCMLEFPSCVLEQRIID